MAEAHRVQIGVAEIFYDGLKQFFLGPLAAVKRANSTVHNPTGFRSETWRLALLLVLYLVEIAAGVLMFLLLWSISLSIELLVNKLFDSSTTDTLIFILATVTLFFFLSFLVRSTIKLIRRV